MWVCAAIYQIYVWIEHYPVTLRPCLYCIRLAFQLSCLCAINFFFFADNGIILTQLGVEFTENIIFLHCLTINSPTLTWMSEKYIGANGEEYRFATIHDVGEQRPLVVNQMTTSIANLTSRYRNENREWVLESILLVKVYASAGTGKSNVFCVHDNGTRKSVTIVPGGEY